jgi:competence protein ComEC
MSEATVRVAAIRDGRTWRPAGGWSRLRVAGELADVAPGDRLEVFGQLGRTPAPLNPGQYDWAAAERRDGRFTEVFCDAPQCVTLERAAPLSSLSRRLYALRSWCSGQLAANVPSRDAPLVLATLLGDQERLGESTKDAFMKTGSIHLLVISGAHVAMLAAIVWGVAKVAGFSTRGQAAATLGMVLLYAAIVGPDPSVVRATVIAATVIGGAACASGQSVRRRGAGGDAVQPR